jgi:hypothetical protein
MPPVRRKTGAGRGAVVVNSSVARQDHAPGVIGSSEAVAEGLVYAVSGTAVAAIRGIHEVGAEIGTTAVDAVRGTIQAAEEIGGDLGRLAKNASIDVVALGRDLGQGMGRAVADAAEGTVSAVRRAGASVTNSLGMGPSDLMQSRRPLRKVETASTSRRRRRSSAA